MQNLILKFFNNHPNQTKNPQTYSKHAAFAIYNSFYLIVAGFIGIIHWFFPFLFPFYTSSIVIKSFKKLVESDRHNNEVLNYMRFGIKNKKIYELKPDSKAPQFDTVKDIQIIFKIDE